MAAKYIFFAIALFFGMAWGQTDIPGLLVGEDVTLPTELQGKIDPKTVESIQNKSITEFKSRCEKNGGPDAFMKAQNASKVLMDCMTSLVNVSSLQKEIEDAKPNGQVDEVFKKYCEKKPSFEVCLHNFTETSKACLAPEEKKHLKTVYNVTEQLAEFICFKEGDRIALFIAEGGQECFQDKQEALQDCFNKTFGTEMDMNVDKLSDVTIAFDEKQCKQIVNLQECVVTQLEQCQKPTSANIVESLFKFIRKSTPCKGIEDAATKSMKGSSASGLLVTSSTIIMALTAALFV